MKTILEIAVIKTKYLKCYFRVKNTRTVDANLSKLKNVIDRKLNQIEMRTFSLFVCPVETLESKCEKLGKMRVVEYTPVHLAGFMFKTS